MPLFTLQTSESGKTRLLTVDAAVGRLHGEPGSLSITTTFEVEVLHAYENGKRVELLFDEEFDLERQIHRIVSTN